MPATEYFSAPVPKHESASLVDVLLNAAGQRFQSSRCVVGASKPDAVSFTYAELLEQARVIAGGLRKYARKPGTRIILLLEHPGDFIPTFWACVLSGYVPCPLAPLHNDSERWARQLAHLDSLLEHPAFITTKELMGELPEEATSIDLAVLRCGTPSHYTHRAQGSDAAILMLTSGSTNNSKAVVITHDNLLASMAGKAERQRLTAADVTLNWISFDHVAALVEVHLLSLYVGATQLHVLPEVILAEPLTFLHLIDRNRVSVTFAPNFLLGQINSLLQAPANGGSTRERPGLDLSCVRHIISGGEANLVSTGRRFLDLLAGCGLSVNALWPAFGMTETCAGSVYSSEFPDCDIDCEFASVGEPICGLEMRVVDDRDLPMPTGEHGELQLRGPMIFSHYYNNDEATNEAFTTDGWFRTGDVGRIDNGRLSLVGRSKDSIIVSGVNYFSHELETTLEQLTGIERSFVAAFPTRPKGAETEQLVITFATTFPLGDEEKLYYLLVAVRNTAIMFWGFRPALILPLPKTVFPKTSLGKIQRSLMRRRLEAGEFESQITHIGSIAYRRLGPHVPAQGAVEPEVAKVFAEIFDVDAERLSATASFFDLGGTSLDIVKLSRVLETRFGLETTLTTIVHYPTVRELARLVETETKSQGRAYDPIVPMQLSGSGVPLFCVHPGDGGTLIFINLAKYFVNERPFYALRPRGAGTGEESFASFDELVHTYVEAIRERQPNGPYALAGYSLGGAIAFEIARALENQGERVAFLGCIDTYPCGEPDKLDFAGAVLGAAQLLQLVNAKQFAAWSRVAGSLQNLSRAYRTSGLVKAMTVFCSAGYPTQVTPDEWLDRLKRWDKFVLSPKYVQVQGDHVTLMAPKHVASFQAILRSEIALTFTGSQHNA